MRFLRTLKQQQQAMGHQERGQERHYNVLHEADMLILHLRRLKREA
jgi:hypothetical protein